MIQRIFLALLPLFIISCYQPERDCQAFRNGTFEFTAEIDGEDMTTTFVRDDKIEIDYFKGKKDTSEIRWINDCEYIVKKIHPKNMSEEKSIHMKILSTTADSYIFEYGIVGDPKKSRGKAVKIN